MRIIADCHLNFRIHNHLGKAPLWFKCLIFLPIFVLTGCASKPSSPPIERTPEFVAGGKISLRSPDDSRTASFRWTQYSGQYELEVWGPLGQGRSQLLGNREQMIVRQGQEVLAEGTPEEIMGAYLGWVIPVELLSEWIQGEGIEPGAPTREAAGWQVEFSRFVAHADGQRPGRFDARKGLQRVIVLVRSFSQ